LGAVLVFLIFLPIIEEIVFRALLYPALAQRFADNWRGLLATTAVFVGYYLIQTAGDLSEWSVIYGGIIFPLVLGFTAGLARATNKSTWSALACHFGFNLFLVFKAALLFG
jgi:membrane protease YdiL (CAAX protease family)